METSVNNKCRAFTSLEQSRKLAEILPLESADIVYLASAEEDDGETLYTAEYKSEVIIYEADDYINCWSLVALLNVLPNYQLQTQDDGIGILCSCNGKFNIVTADNPIDACYELIIKLHEQNLL